MNTFETTIYRAVIQTRSNALGIAYVEVEVTRKAVAKLLQLQRLRDRKQLSSVTVELHQTSLNVQWIEVGSRYIAESVWVEVSEYGITIEAFLYANIEGAVHSAHLLTFPEGKNSFDFSTLLGESNLRMHRVQAETLWAEADTSWHMLVQNTNSLGEFVCEPFAGDLAEHDAGCNVLVAALARSRRAAFPPLVDIPTAPAWPDPFGQFQTYRNSQAAIVRLPVGYVPPARSELANKTLAHLLELSQREDWDANTRCGICTFCAALIVSPNEVVISVYASEVNSDGGHPFTSDDLRWTLPATAEHIGRPGWWLHMNFSSLQSCWCTPLDSEAAPHWIQTSQNRDLALLYEDYENNVRAWKRQRDQLPRCSGDVAILRVLARCLDTLKRVDRLSVAETDF